MENVERVTSTPVGTKPRWQAPRMVVQGHVTEIVATAAKGKDVYGPDKDGFKG